MAQQDQPSALKSSGPWHYVRHALAMVVGLLAIIVMAIAMPHLTRQLDGWGLLPRHERLTELYLPDAESLAHTYTAGSPHDVRFEIRNLEGATQTYRYTVTVRQENGKGTTKIDNGSVTLRNGESSDVRLSAELKDLGKRVYIEIALSNGQEIGYWLEQER